MRTPRSYLFVPGQKPALFDKAAGAGADAIILDLEDAVGPEQKDSARSAVSGWLGAGGTAVVRINGSETPWFADDIAALADAPCTAVMVPKATPARLTDVADRLPGKPLIALVETADGLAGLRDMAGLPGLARLAFGNLDFGADLRIPGTGPVLDPARFEVVLASRLAGLPQPVDGVTTDLRDEAVLSADLRRARDLGFTGKLCIHPAQVAAANTLLGPDEAEIDWAHRVVEALQASGGAVVQVDGKMIDTPLIRKAVQVLGDAGLPVEDLALPGLRL